MTNDIKSDGYDRGIIPAETAARMEREGDTYKTVPQQEDNESLDATSGFTVDREGLLNNYAVEPEMYIETPGDLQEAKEANRAERAQELEEVNETDEEGKLTMKKDERGKGTGII